MRPLHVSKKLFLGRAVVDLAKVRKGGKSRFSAFLTLDVRDLAQAQISYFLCFLGLCISLVVVIIISREEKFEREL